MKKGDKIRFNGYGDGTGYSYLTVGKVYEVIRIGECASEYAVILDDRGEAYVWSYPLEGKAKRFNLVTDPLPTPQAPIVHDGDIIEFLGTKGHRVRYRDTTVGKRYKVRRIEYSEFGEVESVYYLDDADDEVNWNIRFENEWNHFKVHSNGQGAKGIYKDDVIHTRPTKLDLESMMDLALDLEDISWAQEIYNQIQQLEGEHA